MNRPFHILQLALLVLMPVLNLQALATVEKKPAAHPQASGPFAWENAIVHIEVTSKAYNYVQPWERSEHKVYKSGVVVDGHQIITTADGLADQTLIRLKKQGDGLFSLGRVVWIDYQANLAALTTDEKDFWTGLQPAKLADTVPITGQVRILRWRDDQLENRQGEIERMTVENSALSFVSVPALKVDSSIPGAGRRRAHSHSHLVHLAHSQSATGRGLYRAGLFRFHVGPGGQSSQSRLPETSRSGPWGHHQGNRPQAGSYFAGSPARCASPGRRL